MAKRGLSIDDKRRKLMEIFTEKMEFFQLRELELIGKKEKGLNPIQLKELVQSLIDDRLVDTDKIGISTYYWSFVSNIYLRKMLILKEVNKEEVDFLKRIKEINIKDSPSHNLAVCHSKNILINQIEKNAKEISNLTAKIDKLLDTDPLLVETRKKEIKLAIISANRWTDNIYSVLSWCKRKFNIEEQKLEKTFEIPDDLDYITT